MTLQVCLSRIMPKAFLVALAASILIMPTLADDKPADESEFLFYPLPPDRPRLQFLASFSTSLDVSTENSGFRDFIFGGKDKEGHLVEKPYGLAVHDGAIYVVDARGGGWVVFDLKNKRSAVVQPGGGGSLKKPINIAIDSDGTKYVTDTGREQVLVYDSNNKFRKALGTPGQFKPVDVAIVDDRLYVTDNANHQVHVLNKQSGEILFSFGGSGQDEGKLRHPTNITVATDGTLYVVDSTNLRVQQFSLDGDFIRAFGQPGTVPGTFSRPKGIAIDHKGIIYVSDAAFENVQIFAQDGGALMAFGAPGGGRDSINLPTVVKIDYQNIRYFEKYIDPAFEVEYLVLVASQFGANKIAVFGYGSPRQ